MEILDNLSPNNFASAIRKCLVGAQNADLAVSYIKKSVSGWLCQLLAENGVKTRIITTRDFGLTEPGAIADLIADGNAQVKVYNHQEGTYHPKLMLFHGDSTCACIVGSANLTYSALYKNVECGILVKGDMARGLQRCFENLWDDKNAISVDQQYLENWRQEIETAKAVREKLMGTSDAGTLNPLLDFLKSRLQAGNDDWRGWYIIPDHGYISPELLERLVQICKVFIGSDSKSFEIRMDADDEHFQAILSIVEQRVKRLTPKTSAKDLFVKAEKNYLMKFDFVDENRQQKALGLTVSGVRFAKAASLEEMKAIFTQAVEKISFRGIELLDFVRSLVRILGHIDLDEFDFFVSHATSADSVNDVAGLIRAYRGLSDADRQQLKETVDWLLQQIEAAKGKKAVVMNYKKHVKTSFVVFGFCNGLIMLENEAGQPCRIELDQFWQIL